MNTYPENDISGKIGDRLLHLYGNILPLTFIKNNKLKMKILNFLNGYKTYIIGFCGLVYGMYTQNSEIIVTSLGLLGLRQAISNL
ncbi:hypothetical protein M0R04_13905 [Candidatus Dojkabacteria bacterium]|jgi:hypothetical protein|nr:hypothetical protein [Candidatus Dojkabacteria bacterium]